MKIEMLLQRLEAEQAKLAVQALEAPSGKDVFEYGRACGMYAGMEHAKRVLLDLVSEKNRKDEIL
jgi:hypothetical protein